MDVRTCVDRPHGILSEKTMNILILGFVVHLVLFRRISICWAVWKSALVGLGGVGPMWRAFVGRLGVLGDTNMQVCWCWVVPRYSIEVISMDVIDEMENPPQARNS